MTLAWDGRHLNTISDFRAWLTGLSRYRWIQGVTLHHTAIPTLDQWHGRTTFDGTRNYYRDVKQWDAGPHFFVAKSSPSPQNDGIWVGTPPSTPGVHAGVCNSTHLGLEFVGDYDHHPYTNSQKAYLFDVLDCLFDWLVLPVTAWTLRGHRECLPNKTCPGAAIDMSIIRQELVDYRATFTNYYVIGVGTRVRSSPNTQSTVLRKYNSADAVRVHQIVHGELYRDINGRESDLWAELIGGGYIWYPLLRK